MSPEEMNGQDHSLQFLPDVVKRWLGRDPWRTGHIVYLLGLQPLTYAQLVSEELWSQPNGPSRRQGIRDILRVLKLTDILDPSRGKLTLSKDRPDFLNITMTKHVRISRRMDRSVSIVRTAVALKGGITDLHLGVLTMALRGRNIPHIRPRQYVRFNHDGTRVRGKTATFSRTVREHQKWEVVLHFDPPLTCGEYVRCGFYDWSPGHFAKTEQEAIERFGNPRSREGIFLQDPTVHLRIGVSFPSGFVARDLRRDIVTNAKKPLTDAIIDGWKPKLVARSAVKAGDVRGTASTDFYLVPKGVACFLDWRPHGKTISNAILSPTMAPKTTC